MREVDRNRFWLLVTDESTIDMHPDKPQYNQMNISEITVKSFQNDFPFPVLLSFAKDPLSPEQGSDSYDTNGNVVGFQMYAETSKYDCDRTIFHVSVF